MRIWRRKKKYKQEELKDRVMHLQNEISKLEEIIHDLDRRIMQLEIARKVGF